MRAVTLLGLALLALRPGHAEDELELDLVGDDDPVLAGDSSYEDALGVLVDGDAEARKWLLVLADAMELLPNLSNWNEGGKLPIATPQKSSADTEELVDAIQHRGTMYTQVAVNKFEDLSIQAIVGDLEAIGDLKELLIKWTQVANQLNYEDDDPVQQAALALQFAASKLSKVVSCLPVDTCSPKDAWWAAREGRASGSRDTKWARVLERQGLLLSILKRGEDFSSDMQRAYEVGGDFGGMKAKQAAWENNHTETHTEF